ncbi:hypothetical protein B5X24_HaOG207730 [Helicoverpa armigera]|uniref:Uncharacterized protein n=1 Tax=Helicoverpa armigera TaxID=29058 RepID=A0A2W1BHC3_HELAM|nr:hypothetical protein B5X24_HaOG207730 [Helicoverpa armigera]
MAGVGLWRGLASAVLFFWTCPTSEVIPELVPVGAAEPAVVRPLQQSATVFGNTTAADSAAHHNDIIGRGERRRAAVRGATRDACAGLTAKVEAERFCRAPPRCWARAVAVTEGWRERGGAAAGASPSPAGPAPRPPPRRAGPLPSSMPRSCARECGCAPQCRSGRRQAAGEPSVPHRRPRHTPHRHHTARNRCDSECISAAYRCMAVIQFRDVTAVPATCAIIPLTALLMPRHVPLCNISPSETYCNEETSQIAA